MVHQISALLPLACARMIQISLRSVYWEFVPVFGGVLEAREAGSTCLQLDFHSQGRLLMFRSVKVVPIFPGHLSLNPKL